MCDDMADKLHFETYQDDHGAWHWRIVEKRKRLRDTLCVGLREHKTEHQATAEGFKVWRCMTRDLNIGRAI